MTRDALLNPSGSAAKRYGYETPQRVLNLVAELRRCRTQRDENLANVRRIDDLRIADTAWLQRELDAAEEVIAAAEAVRLSGGSLLSMSALSTALAAHKQAKAGEGA